MATRADTDHWPRYNKAQRTRGVRDLCAEIIDRAGPGAGRRALDLGAGAGVETRALLAAGWSVHAIDSAPGSATQIREGLTGERAARLTIGEHSFADLDALPASDLVYAGYSLPFMDRNAFGDFWPLLTESVRPGGWVAVNLFGASDTWAADTSMNFWERSEIEALFAGLEQIEVREAEYDGMSFSGPKHWHVFDVIARRSGR
ncbi:class I SAM-dependent methyltransferase [Glutamicibacter endophyticus]